MLKVVSLPIAAASLLLSAAAAADRGVPIPTSLADKSTPTLIYDLAEPATMKPRHKIVPRPAGPSSNLILPPAFVQSGFKGLSPYHGAAQVMLGMESFDDWKLQQAPAPKPIGR